MEKIKIDFFSDEFIESKKEKDTSKSQIDVMKLVGKAMSDPKRIKKIVIGIVLFVIMGISSTIYLTIIYSHVLIPVYMVAFLFLYIYGKRKIIFDKIKYIFTIQK